MPETLADPTVSVDEVIVVSLREEDDLLYPLLLQVPLRSVHKRLTGYLQCIDAGVLFIPYTTGPGALGDEQRKAASDFARKLVEA